MIIKKELLILITSSVFLLGCQSKQEKMFMRGCSDSIADDSVCSCAYKSLNKDFSKQYGDDWGENRALLMSDDFANAMQKAALECKGN